MRATFTDDPGVADKRYTVSGNENVPFGAFDTQDEVAEIVKSKPNGACTIRFGAGVTFDSPEHWELRRKIEALEKPWVCPICGGIGRVGGLLPESCKIPGKSVGEECLAMRQLEVAQQALDASTSDPAASSR